MLPSDNFFMIGTILYGAVFMLAASIVSVIMQLYGVTFLMLFAIAVCYLQMYAAVLQMRDALQVSLFWVSFVSAGSGAVILAYHLIMRF